VGQSKGRHMLLFPSLWANPSINRTPKKLRFLCAGYVKR